MHSSPSGPSTALVILGVLLAQIAAAAEVHPIEAELRRDFPTVAIESAATFEPADTFVHGALASGLRPRFARVAKSEIAVPAPMPGVPTPEQPIAGGEPALQVLYPRSYDGLIVVELGAQRVVLRATGALASSAVEVNGKLLYIGPYASTDAVEVPREGRSEELLLLRDERAPRTYEYEIVDTEGVAAVALDDGAVRFLRQVAPPAMSDVVTGRFTHREPSLQIDRPWLIDAAGRRSEKQAAWTLIGGGAIPKGIRLTLTAERLAFPIVVDPSFSATGSLATARQDHTATLLPNGKVLITGGYNITSGYLASAELYDPSSGTFSATDSLGSARRHHTATLLPNGKVLIAGGYNSTSPYYLTSAELYNPSSGTFSATGSLGTARYRHTATLLPNGKVLIAGGYNITSGSLASAELYDPTSGTFSATGSLGTARTDHTATLLPNGKVLLAGGFGGTWLTSAELYDPTSGTWSATGSLSTARVWHTATLLSNGKVLIAGGYRGGGVYLTSAELYDPTIGTFSPTGSLGTGRYFHTTTLLPNGKVLIAGGYGTVGGAAGYLTSSELYDPTSGTFSPTGSLGTGRSNHTATLLPNGKVLIAGGYGTAGGTAGYLKSAELYDPTSGSFSATGSLGTARAFYTATLLPNGKVLIAGGLGAGGSLTSAELYDPASGTFSVTGSLGTARDYHTATLLPNGKVLIAGGGNGSVFLASAELYDPSSGTFSATGSLGTARAFHTATLLANGKVMIAGGGYYNGVRLDSAELYDPTSGTFNATGRLGDAHEYHTATLLPNGKVLIALGMGSYGSQPELYDPSSGTFSATGSFGTSLYHHTATLLPNGKVLIAGGDNFTGLPVVTAKLYDPSSGTFSATGSLGTARAQHTATLLPNGKVLIAGGYPPALDSAELYDPSSGTFSATGTPSAERGFHTATLLPNGKVLIAGGSNGIVYLTSAELYDVGDGFSDARRPVITSAPTSLTLPSTFTMSGSGFRGDSEASSGGTNSSATNYPIVQLLRIDNERSFFVTPNAAFTDVSWSASLGALATGWYRATLFTNAIPSVQQLISITTPTPTNVLATAASTTSVLVTWTAAPGATTYEVRRSANGTTFTTLTGAVSGTSFSDLSALANTAYLYLVRASAPYVSEFSAPDLATTVIFTDPTLVAGTTTVKAVHVTQLRTAVNAVRQLAGLQAPFYTDPTITAGVTIVKAAHVDELRTNLYWARSALSLPPISYSHPWLTVRVSLISAVDINELRNGTQ